MFRRDLNALRHSLRASEELRDLNGRRAQDLQTLASHRADKHVEELLEEPQVSLLIKLVK